MYTMVFWILACPNRAQLPCDGVVALIGGGFEVAFHEPQLLQGLKHIAMPQKPLDPFEFPHHIVAECAPLWTRRGRQPFGGLRQVVSRMVIWNQSSKRSAFGLR